MPSPHPKIVESPHYHLWTDALHARALAHQARNKWDRGTYVRWTVNTAWTTLEVACQDALQDTSISYSFRKNLDKAIQNKSLPPLDWGQGLWQEVQKVQDCRKGYVHRFLTEPNLFPDIEVADSTITVVREAIVAIYTHAHRVVPAWVQDDEDRGWDVGPGSYICATTIHKGASHDDPQAIQVCYVWNGKEHIHDVLPPGTNAQPYCEDLLAHLRVPASAIRVYSGDKLVSETQLVMRGS